MGVDSKHKISVTVAVKDETKAVTKNVQKQFKAVGKSAEDAAAKTVKSSKASVVSLGAVAVAVAAAVAAYKGMRAATRFVAESVTLSDQQAAAEDKVTLALRLRGEATAENIKLMKDIASATQDVTTTGDELILSQQAILLNFGVSTDQVGEATRAALDMAAALDMDVVSAFRNVGKTMSGMAGELGENVSELRALTAEELKAGEGITVLAEKFAGFAATEAATFGGSLEQINNLWGDFKENVGDIIRENPQVLAAFQVVRDVIGQLGDNAGEASNALSDQLGAAIIVVARSFKSVVGIVGLLGQGFQGLKAVWNTVNIAILTGVERTFTAFTFLGNKLVELVNKFRDEGKQLANPFNEGSEALKRMVLGAEETRDVNLDAFEAVRLKTEAWQRGLDGVIFSLESALPAAAQAMQDAVVPVVGNLTVETQGAADAAANIGQNVVEIVDRGVPVIEQMEERSTAFADTLSSSFGSAGESIGGAFIAAAGAGKDSAKIIGSAFSKALGQVVTDVIKVAITQVTANAATAASGAASSQAGIPIIGPILATAAMGLIFGLVSGLVSKIPKFQQGGFVPGVGRGDTVPALLEPGELVVPRRGVAMLLKLMQGSAPGLLNSSPMPSAAMSRPAGTLGFQNGGIVPSTRGGFGGITIGSMTFQVQSTDGQLPTGSALESWFDRDFAPLFGNRLAMGRI